MALREQNTYYNDSAKAMRLRDLVISPVQAGGFQTYMKKIGKLGGQNKVSTIKKRSFHCGRTAYSSNLNHATPDPYLQFKMLLSPET